MARANFFYAQPSLFPNPTFKADVSVDKIEEADGKVDVSALLRLLGRLTVHQRVKLARAFAEKKKSDLLELVKAKVKDGDCLELVQLLFLQPDDRDVTTIKEALAKKKEKLLYIVDVILTRTNYELDRFKQCYLSLNKVDLYEDLSKNVPDPLILQACKSLLDMKRPEPSPEDLVMENYSAMWSKDAAMSDAVLIRNGCLKQLKTDPLEFIKFLTTRSNPQLRAMKKAYDLQTGKCLYDFIKENTKSDQGPTVLAIAKALIEKEVYFADRVWASVKGVGTKDDMLRRLVASRVEVDMEDVKLAFALRYNDSLVNSIISDTSGDYQKLFTYIIGG